MQSDFRCLCGGTFHPDFTTDVIGAGYRCIKCREIIWYSEEIDNKVLRFGKDNPWILWELFKRKLIFVN